MKKNADVRGYSLLLLLRTFQPVERVEDSVRLAVLAGQRTGAWKISKRFEREISVESEKTHMGMLAM
jgi:hypothetical protein